MTVGCGLGFESMLPSVLRMQACSRVLGYSMCISMLKDVMSGHVTGCGGADLHNLLASAFSISSELFSA